MDQDQNWYRQLLALVLVAASKAAVDFITNTKSREEAVVQLRGAFGEIDYDSLAKALTKGINQAADTSKDALADAIDTLRSRGVDVVDDARDKAEKQLGHKKGGKMKWIFAFLLAAVAGYFLSDQQRRDELMDKLTGASGPIQPPANTVENATQNPSPQPPSGQPQE
ncbi:MAG: hypothetical protein ACRDFS_13645 [Chloroflexota bacterium]